MNDIEIYKSKAKVIGDPDSVEVMHVPSGHSFVEYGYSIRNITAIALKKMDDWLQENYAPQYTPQYNKTPTRGLTPGQIVSTPRAAHGSPLPPPPLDSIGIDPADYCNASSYAYKELGVVLDYKPSEGLRKLYMDRLNSMVKEFNESLYTNASLTNV